MRHLSGGVDPGIGAPGGVDPVDALTLEHEGRIYRFCSEECLDAFQDEPDVFVDEEVGDSTPLPN